MHTIVVGVDGSDSSLNALRFAIAEARIRGGEVRAVNAWHIPAVVYEVGWAAVSVDLDEFAKVAEESLRKSLQAAGALDSEVTVTSIVAEGQAADVLCEQAQGADLLVVGSRGLGGFRGLLVGSVSQQCASRAPCPVVIIPHAGEVSLPGDEPRARA